MNNFLNKLKKSYINKNLIELYFLEDNEFEEDVFIIVGTIISMNTDYILFEGVSTDCLLSSYYYICINFISHIRTDTPYIKQIKDKIEIRKKDNLFNCFNLDLEQIMNNFDILPGLDGILEILKEKNAFCKIIAFEINDDEEELIESEGYIGEFGSQKVLLKIISPEENTATNYLIKKQHICSISFMGIETNLHEKYILKELD